MLFSYLFGYADNYHLIIGGVKMAVHNFNFEGGEILTGMGASWFVSYAYYERIDKNHRNWDRVATKQTRISKYNIGRKYHEFWLREILLMNPANLNRNTIGLRAEGIQRMAKELLIQWHD